MSGERAVAAAKLVNGPERPSVTSATCAASAICVWITATWVLSRVAAWSTCCTSSRCLLFALTADASHASTTVMTRTTAATITLR